MPQNVHESELFFPNRNPPPQKKILFSNFQFRIYHIGGKVGVFFFSGNTVHIVDFSGNTQIGFAAFFPLFGR